MAIQPKAQIGYDCDTSSIYPIPDLTSPLLGLELHSSGTRFEIHLSLWSCPISESEHTFHGHFHPGLPALSVMSPKVSLKPELGSGIYAQLTTRWSPTFAPVDLVVLFSCSYVDLYILAVLLSHHEAFIIQSSWLWKLRRKFSCSYFASCGLWDSKFTKTRPRWSRWAGVEITGLRLFH